MHKHQMDVLIAELKRPEYAGLSADKAFSLLTGRKQQTGTAGKMIDTRSEAEKRLTATHFMSLSAHDALPPKHRQKSAVVLPDEQVAGWQYTYGQDREGKGGKTGWQIPGFPNSVRRHEFDQAWNARN